MNPHPSPDAVPAGGFFAAAANYGVNSPRPRLLLVALMLLALCIVLITAIDLAFLSDRVNYMLSLTQTKTLPHEAMRAGDMNTILFVTAMAGGMLALIAFGHSWARWVWLLLCMLAGSGLALVWVGPMFLFAPGAAMVKCGLFVLQAVLTCLLFAPSSNAWFRRLRELRDNPRRQAATPAAYQGTAPADGQAYHPYAPPGTLAGAAPAAVALPARPRTVTLGMALCVLSSLAGMVISLIYMPDVLAAQSVSLGTGWVKNTVYGSLVVGALLLILLMYFIARASNVARWIWLVVAVFGFLNSINAFKTAFVVSALYGSLAVLTQLIVLAGTILLFVPASNQWMRDTALARRP
ncbi:hypothetical protein IV454_28220 [Massilia antarctica]|uniref:Uncharacterized protein n=1 Tax=Massilia antarctica TaxID=2765360 RepID=A0AA49A7Z2_9BURK|nr:hypothetical protein [Massilia antarctica]QPI49292.1 hypothetical protein IV454_28220 [Massilia antarctica]